MKRYKASPQQKSYAAKIAQKLGIPAPKAEASSVEHGLFINRNLVEYRIAIGALRREEFENGAWRQRPPSAKQIRLAKRLAKISQANLDDIDFTSGSYYEFIKNYNKEFANNLNKNTDAYTPEMPKPQETKSMLTMNTRQSVVDIAPAELLDIVKNYEGTLLVRVTPELANEILKLNVRNRKTRHYRAEELAQTIKRGGYKLTGEPLIISKEGILNDGQHRLLAVIHADMPIVTDIRFGISHDAFDATGQSSPRSTADILGIAGHRQEKRLSSVINMVCKILWTAMKDDSAPVPTDMAVQAAKIDPDFERAVELAVSTKLRPLQNGVGYALFYFIIKHGDEAKLQDFHSMISTGTNLEGDNPVYKLREKLNAEFSNNRKLSTRTKIALCFKAWKAFYEGRRILFLKVNKDEAMPRLEVNLPADLQELLTSGGKSLRWLEDDSGQPSQVKRRSQVSTQIRQELPI